MQKLTSHISAFSLILAMWITLLLSLTGLFLIEYMVPFSHSVKWIENSSKAFYQSYGSLENAIYSTYSGAESQIWYEPTSRSLWSNSIDYGYSVISSGSVIPLAWNGNSDFNTDWNQISQNTPVHLYVWDNRVSEINVEIRVPNGQTLRVSEDDDLVLWQISSNSDSLSADNIIDLGGGAWNDDLFWEDGFPLSSHTVSQRFSTFYSNECWVGDECVLKLSVVKPLILSDGTEIPYLEYKINTNGNAIPFQESYISTKGKSFGFQKSLNVALPHSSTSSAFDFTVLQ